MQQETEITIPFSADAERFLLGSLMLDATRLRLCERAGLTVKDFFLASTREVYRVMLERADRHPVEFDPVSLVTYLRESGQYERVGGHAGIGEFLEHGIARFFGDDTFLVNLERVKEAGRKRSLLAQANKALADLSDGERNSKEIASDLKTLSEQVERGTDLPVSLGDLVTDALQRFENRRERPSPGLMLGCPALDDLTGGVHKGNLFVLAGRAGIGKSALAVQWALRALQDGQPVAFFSLEMSGQEILDRCLRFDSKISSDSFRHGLMSQSELPHWQQTREWFISLPPLHVRDRIGSQFAAVASEARAIVSRTSLAMIIVDHLQLFEGSRGRKNDTRTLELAEVTRGLKQLARELDTVVVLLSQLNRSIETRGGAVPRLADLRDSGSIEQDADQVLFVTQSAQVEGAYREATLHLTKNRHGRSGDVKIAFNHEKGFFEW